MTVYSNKELSNIVDSLDESCERLDLRRSELESEVSEIKDRVDSLYELISDQNPSYKKISNIVIFLVLIWLSVLFLRFISLI